MKATTLAALLFLSFASPAAGHTPPGQQDAARGLVYSSLQRARPGSPCRTAFELALPHGRTGCTHGPDAAPPGLDVRRWRSLGELAASTQGPSDTFAADSSVYCSGDGTSGNRVQAVYAHPADGVDNYDEIAPYIERWAGIVDTVFNDSAAETGGVRHVRFVTRPDCRLEVAKVALSPAGVRSLAGTAADLAAQGFDRPDRKYLVWVDDYLFCGLATVKPDDRAGAANANNGDGEPGMVARVDRGCWGGISPSIEAHELVHLLGGVQPSAPNMNDNFHCTDEADALCYDDDGVEDGFVAAHGEPAPLRSVCPPAHERLLDCGHDDYFHTAPTPENYLATHWNVAESSFLTAEGVPSVPDTAAPRPTAPTARLVGAIEGGRVPVRLSWSSRDPDAVGYWLWQSVDGGAWSYVRVPNRAATSVVLRLARGHGYRFLVHAFDAAGNASPAAVGPQFRVRLLEERNSRISYRGGWRRRYRSFASARYLSSPTSGWAAARLTFTGRAVAWVSRQSPLGGRARVFVDGRYAGTVSLASPTFLARKVVFSRRWSRVDTHTISIRPIGTRPRAPVDAFVVLD